jgi:hypothetical protein
MYVYVVPVFTIRYIAIAATCIYLADSPFDLLYLTKLPSAILNSCVILMVSYRPTMPAALCTNQTGSVRKDDEGRQAYFRT